MRRLLFGLLLIPSLGSAAPMTMAPARSCTIEPAREQAMLDARYDAFDQAMDGAGSWRPLVNDGCYAAAAKIVAQYIKRHAAELTPEQKWTMNFHVGQVLAMGGEDAQSVVWFERSRDTRADAEWLAYVDATLAFLRKDKTALAAARGAYAAAPRHNALRLAVIDGFAACIAKPYLEAMMCTPG